MFISESDPLENKSPISEVPQGEESVYLRIKFDAVLPLSTDVLWHRHVSAYLVKGSHISVPVCLCVRLSPRAPVMIKMHLN